MSFLVADTPFNRANYPSIIGKVFDAPPGYAQVKIVTGTAERPPEKTVGTQLLKAMVEHTIDDISYEQINRIVRRLKSMPPADRAAPKRVATVIFDELGPEKAIQYVEKAFANGLITANDYYALRAELTFPMPRQQVPVPLAGIGSQQLIQGQRRLQQDLGKIRDLGIKSLQKPAEALNKDIQRLRHAWEL